MAEYDEQTPLKPFSDDAPVMGTAAHDDGTIDWLADLVDGCKDDVKGRRAKQSIVQTYVTKHGGDIVDIILTLHVKGCILIDTNGLLNSLSWRKPHKPDTFAVEEASHPGTYLTSALAACAEGEMKEVVEKFLRTTKDINVIDVIRFANKRGYVQVSAEALLSPGVADWNKPTANGKVLAEWKKIWAGVNRNPLPGGGSMYVNARDSRGRKASIAFLGGYTDSGVLSSPQSVLYDTWKLPSQSMCINLDAGSMHPRQCDSINNMAHLPQFSEIVEEAQGKNEAGAMPPSVARTIQDAGAPVPVPADSADSGAGVGSGWSRARSEMAPVSAPSATVLRLQDIVRRTVAAWQNEMRPVDTDALMMDGSINNIIYTKLKDVMSALLDAAALSGACIVVDRTNGQGSATAEYLLEQALERGGTKPTIIAIDSLERLGRAKSGSHAHEMIMQLRSMYYTEDAASQTPLGTERELEIDWLYELDEFEYADAHAEYPDSRLPFEVLAEHQRKDQGNTCDPLRKWRYFYMDGLFASASHYVIKSNDIDEFNMDSIAPNGFLYAHGDTRTFKRLRNNIQAGRPIVMLHNSGGVVTAFSWLQRVMAFSRPPPDPQQLRGPLKYVIACLSKANWTKDFGMPEIIMTKTLAERAPALFRKNIVSVDVLTETAEDVITSCFATSGGVPELGLGNAESNVVFNAWNTHTMLCQNARRFWRFSVLAQLIVWTLALSTTAVAITVTSMGTGHDPDGMVLQRFLETSAESTKQITDALKAAALVMPIVAGFVTTVMSRLLWRDKWSVCVMAATQIASEIFKFRMSTLEYDMRPKPVADGEEPKVLTAKEKARLARQTFVERIQALYGCCMTEMSQSTALRRKHQKVSKDALLATRTNQESKLTLAEWFKLKVHVEHHFYKSSWALPDGSFVNWISGLRPYLQQRSLREEIQAAVTALVAERKVVLRGSPLTDAESTHVRRRLATQLGLPPVSFERQKVEIRQLQKQVVTAMYKQQLQDEKEMAAAGVAPATSMPRMGGMRGARVAPVDDDDAVEDPKDAMRRLIMEMQGLKYGKLSSDEKAEQKKIKKRKIEVVKAVEDDYLAGPLNIDSYVVFRLRPLKDRLDRQAQKLSLRLMWCDIFGFLFTATGAVFAAFNFTEWISLTVAIVSTLNAVVEFTQLRNQVVSCNLAMRDLENLVTWWNSLSLVRRRTPAVKEQIVSVTESALLAVVDAHTTAASNTQTSVTKQLAAEAEQEEGEKESGGS